MKALVTGGAGFIGSNLANELLREGNEVVILDDLSSGSEKCIPQNARFVKKDIARDDLVKEMGGIDAVFHFAADPDVRSSATNPKKSFDLNVVGTFNVLESCRKSGVKNFVFASTSTVYGEADVMPTPETYSCTPISNYGASKLACEAYISSYAHSYGIRSTILRYANIYGTGSTHGVMFDFFQKLKKEPNRLEILGDGKQEKSYLFISDCISATLTAFEKQHSTYEVFNIGSRQKHDVNMIADLVCMEAGVSPKKAYTGGKQGWVGDVKAMLLDVSKIESLGWSEKVSIQEGVKKYISSLKGESDHATGKP